MTNPPLESQDQTEVQVQSQTTSDNNPPVPAWQSILYETNQRAKRAEDEARSTRLQLEQLERERNTPAPIALEPGVAYNEPEKFAQRILNDVQNVVAPLNQFVEQSNRQQAYLRLKNKIRSQTTPENLSGFQRIEYMIDARFENNPNLPVTEEAFMEEVEKIIGRLAMSGQLNLPQNQNNNPPPTNTPKPPVLPPSNRPSPPSPNLTRQSSGPQLDESRLTENHRRLARENKMTLLEMQMMEDTPPEKNEDTWREILKARKENRRYGA